MKTTAKPASTKAPRWRQVLEKHVETTAKPAPTKKTKSTKGHCCEFFTRGLAEGWLQVPLLQFDRSSGKLVQKTPQVYIETVISDPNRSLLARPPRKPKTVNIFLAHCFFCGKKL